MNKRRGQALCQFDLTKESFAERTESVFSDESFWSMARSVLDERQYNICKRYLSENITYKELGTEYGISQERVRQLLIKGMRKIRRAINNIPCSNISEFDGIENLCLDIRIYNCLKRSGYNTIQDVKDRLIGNEDEIMRVRNLGKKSYVKIVEAIKWFDKESGVK